MLVFDRKSGKISHAIVRDLCDFLPEKYAALFNNSRVIKARLFGAKLGGGKIEALVVREGQEGVLTQIRGRVREGSRLLFGGDLSAIVAKVCENGDRVVRFFERGEPIDFKRLVEILDAIGVVPLPPYIKREAIESDETRYQSCFAKVAGSVAAPTASLHFDPPLLERLRTNREWAEVTLHIGLGTFKSVETADIRDHKMHSEFFQIGEEAARLLESDREIFAVGTTACRVAEYYARTRRLEGECDLFLSVANPPIRVGALMTNFHLPKSTLLMLVASFVGVKKTREIYAEAIAKNYRFYSYGDAMLII